MVVRTDLTGSRYVRCRVASARGCRDQYVSKFVFCDCRHCPWRACIARMERASRLGSLRSRYVIICAQQRSGGTPRVVLSPPWSRSLALSLERERESERAKRNSVRAFLNLPVLVPFEKVSGPFCQSHALCRYSPQNRTFAERIQPRTPPDQERLPCLGCGRVMRLVGRETNQHARCPVARRAADLPVRLRADHRHDDVSVTAAYTPSPTSAATFRRTAWWNTCRSSCDACRQSCSKPSTAARKSYQLPFWSPVPVPPRRRPRKQGKRMRPQERASSCPSNFGTWIIACRRGKSIAGSDSRRAPCATIRRQLRDRSAPAYPP